MGRCKFPPSCISYKQSCHSEGAAVMCQVVLEHSVIYSDYVYEEIFVGTVS